MLIRCQTVDEFIQNCQVGKPYQGMIFVEKHLESATSQPAMQSPSVHVFLKISTILCYNDGGQALLICENYCGIDRSSDGGSSEGSEIYEFGKQSVESYAACNGCSVLPGSVNE